MAKPADLTPKWTQQDRVDLRKFIAEHPGFIRMLLEGRPRTTKDMPADQRGIVGLEIAQHIAAVELIEQLASDEPVNLSDLQG